MSNIAVEQPIDFGSWWAKLRYPLVLVVIGLGLVTLLAAIGAQPNQDTLDPRSTSPTGAHALSVLLTSHGSPVTVATSANQLSSASTTTIVVSNPSDLSDAALNTLAATNSTVVLVDPQQPVLDAFDIDATPDAVTASHALPAGCTLGVAVTAGAADISGDLYAVHGNAQTCYSAGGDASLIKTTRANGASTYVFGSGTSMSNQGLAHEGDAALTIGLIQNEQVEWVPGTLDANAAATPKRGLLHLLPSRLLWAVLQLFVMVVLMALWRARRLGAPVVEPLPVVVRAAETVEGRARLMQAAKARDGAASALRAASILRLSRALRLGADDDPASVVALVAERTSRSATDVRAVLYGGEPRDDAALVKLAQELPRLESAVRQDAPSHGGQP